MAMALRARLLGAADLNAVLNVLGPKYFRPAARKGVRQAAMLATGAAKAGVPVRTKMLRKALGYLVRSNRQRTGYLSVVGPRKDKKGTYIGGKGKQKARFRRSVRMKSYLDRRGGYKRRMVVNPVKYAHLVERGRKAVKVKRKRVLSDGWTIYGVKARASRKVPFMRTARETTLNPARALMWKCFAEALDKVPKVKTAIPYTPKVP